MSIITVLGVHILSLPTVLRTKYNKRGTVYGVQHGVRYGTQLSKPNGAVEGVSAVQ
jgi:hypothetical protein